MTAYIIKSSISLLLLFGLYWFLLRKEKLFVFNRFFLIFSVLFSLIIPFISIPVNLPDNEAGDNFVTAINSTVPVFGQEQDVVNYSEYQSVNSIEAEPVAFFERINFPLLLIFLYLTGVILLFIRFLRNIFFITRQIRSSERIAYSGQRLVLTDNQVNPFCFLNTIFVSKQAYLNNEIAGELLNHELEHIRQAHSLDVIFMELIQIIYWFNPVIILYNRAVRVNHEYLADSGAIQDETDISIYADKLINFITCKRNVPLSSGFNPSLTRKRLIMLTKSRSGRINYFVRIFLTINLAAVIFMILSFKPTYSDPIAAAQNLNEFSILKPAEVYVNDSSNYKIAEEESGKSGIRNDISARETVTAPEKIVKGFVVNKYGKYIEGVKILESGRTSGFVTDEIGHFVLPNVPEDALLTFLLDGYVSQTIKPVFSSEMVVRFVIDKEAGLSKEDIISNYMPKPGTTPIIVIDSVLQERESMHDIDPANKVTSIIVLRGKDATDKYGEKGKNGIIEINSIGNPPGQIENKPAAPETSVSKKLIVVDGVIYDGELNDIPMQSIDVLSVITSFQATRKYGEKGKNGAVEIKTKQIAQVSEEKHQMAIADTMDKALIIVDGIEYNGKIKDIPDKDIQSMSVLQDKSAIAVFGEKGVNGVIIVTTKTKNRVPVQQNSATLVIPAGKAENTNGKDDVVVSTTSYNYLYRGIANPVDVKVSGIAADKITAETTNGNIKRIDTGWEVIPGDQNESIVTIYVSGKKRFEKKFNVRDLPDPVAVFHNKSNGSISRNMAAQSYVLEAALKEPEPNIRFEIVSFKLGMRIDSTDIEIASDGNKFTDEMRSVLDRLTRGKYLLIKDIKAIGPDKKIRDLNPIVLKIN